MSDNPLAGLPVTKRYPIAILVDDHNRRTFPTSKNRSRRIHKKLVKRFGGEFHKKPAQMWLSEKQMAMINSVQGY